MRSRTLMQMQLAAVLARAIPVAVASSEAEPEPRARKLTKAEKKAAKRARVAARKDGAP